MENMWSDKKWVNILINILLFLVSINFMHYGQLILPIICLVIFIDNRFNFKVNDIKTFVVLCLFAISFCAFSYELGFYCIMGFCLPMAYYIGSNLKEVNEKNIKTIIYIIAFGMASHLILNLIYELFIYKFDVLYLLGKSKHYDIWTNTKVSTTITAVNAVFILSCIYYILRYETNKALKVLGIVMFTIVEFYNLAIGRRASLFILLITFLIALLSDYFFFKNRNIDRKRIISILVFLVIFILLIILAFTLNILGLKDILMNLTITKKFMEYGMYSGRINILIDFLKVAPSHLWGGQEISNIIQNPVHDFLNDIYDYAGIIPYILMIIYLIISIKSLYKVLCSKTIKNDIKVLILSVASSIILVMAIEPVMSGSSLFLIVSVIILTLIEAININGVSIK